MSDSVGQYLNEIGAVALLTADDEKMLSKAIEKGRDAQSGAGQRRQALDI